MSSGRKFMDIQRIKQVLSRGLIVFCLSTTLTVALTVFADAKPVAAAAVSATTVRSDRRPDRERPVTTSQGSGSSTQTSSSSARPRLVRR